MRIVVQEWERVLLYRDGRFEEVLEPGRHRRLRWRRRRVRVVVRPRLLVVPGQEVLTADGLSVKVSLTVACRTADPRRWHESVEDADGFVYATPSRRTCGSGWGRRLRRSAWPSRASPCAT